MDGLDAHGHSWPHASTDIRRHCGEALVERLQQVARTLASKQLLSARNAHKKGMRRTRARTREKHPVAGV